MSRYWLVGFRATFWQIWRTGILHLHLNYLKEVVETSAGDICTGQRSKDMRSKNKRRERRNIESDTILHISTSRMSSIQLSNLALGACMNSRSLSEFDNVISVKSPIIVWSSSWPGSIDGRIQSLWIIIIAIDFDIAITIAISIAITISKCISRSNLTASQ